MYTLNKLLKLTLAGLLATSFAPIAALASAEDAERSFSTNSTGTADAANANANAMTDGEVKKVDKGAGRLTIKHGELKNLGMPAMTMVFKVKDASMLDSVRAGDKVDFIAEKTGSQFTVVKLEPKKALQ
jgi:Cu(I)/Ag(I) efflux system periplasmic protein CusF